ncbi:sigma-70 region 4 domain-containing protein [Pseudoxanthomonas sp.]|uniref:sigma-70 region 4 domain-containing protein n=1 Tax=Pseudoxanthomonas sp. TaxID=1871049 RepID=UPI002633329E|nr:sigma-70 region 4 domain-containing protein [Pseudoxanthomonas sp.]WDS36982.1 MAG: sigma-70 region 4 domain-containing protein [Pseudoxanthomonas sp.]
MSSTKDDGMPNPAISAGDRIWLAFLTAVAALPPEVRAAFLLHEAFEASYDEIACVLGLPVETCRDHVARARAHAATRMQPLCGRAGPCP